MAAERDCESARPGGSRFAEIGRIREACRRHVERPDGEIVVLRPGLVAIVAACTRSQKSAGIPKEVLQSRNARDRRSGSPAGPHFA